jgi:hypothetical protein
MPFTGAQKNLDQAASLRSNTQGQFANQVKQNAASGKDNSILKAAAPTQQVPTVQQVNPQIDKTAGQVATDAGGVALDILSAGTYGLAKTAAMKSGELATKAIPSIIGGPLAAMEKASAKKLVEMVSPVVGKKYGVQAIKQGFGKAATFLRPASLSADKATIQAARSVEGIVKKGKSFIENANLVRSAIKSESLALKLKLSQLDRPYVPKELGKALRDVQLPGLLKNDHVLNKTYTEIVGRVMDMAGKMPGKISSVLDVRQAFDKEVEREFGNIYSNAQRDMTPIRQAVKATRGALNDFIEKRVPEAEYKESLHLQTSMFDALDSLAQKGEQELGKVSPLGQKFAKVGKAAGEVAKFAGAFGLAEVGLPTAKNIGSTLLGGNR